MTAKPARALRLHIDWTRCDGRGLCSELLPQLLSRDDWGYPLARDNSREPSVPGRMAKHARRAVARCPRLALTLIDDDQIGTAIYTESSQND
ncbi:ferredoxin [Mycobacterium sp. BK086]|uniref:ferredoxin n=1 Tax=Mycobacterium sp. BK086 TaxID=2512165 RepID=UPI00105F27FC|nr:ferredoxin [Mycobacterium sp. BK086]TDO17379.1 ferredoxin [Mycobacterium sp. BK086]